MDSSQNTSKKVQIVKVPPQDDGVKRTQDSRTAFQDMPRLYLELFENKDKVRQDMMNHEYEPDETMSDISYFKDRAGGRSRHGGDQQNGYRMPTRHEEHVGGSDDESTVSSSSSSSQQHERGRDDVSDDDDHNNGSDASTVLSGDDDVSSSSSRGGQRPKSSLHTQDIHSESSEDFSYEKEDNNNRSREHHHQSSSYERYAEGPPPSHPPKNVPDIYDKILDKTPTQHIPPRLADLKKTGEYVDQQRGHVPDLHRMYSKSVEEEEELKRELLFKFEILKKSYRHLEIPNYTIHTDLRTLTRAYENTLRRVSLDSNVESYKQYLIGGFMLVEFIMSNWLSFDMQGFTQQQILNMNQYERLLIELGEKSYVPGGKSYPVEVRLLMLILTNAAIFIISKIILKKTGNNVMNMMNMFSQPSTSSAPAGGGGGLSSSSPQTKETTQNGGVYKRKMRGPNIDPDDIPDLNTI